MLFIPCFYIPSGVLDHSWLTTVRKSSVKEPSPPSISSFLVLAQFRFCCVLTNGWGCLSSGTPLSVHHSQCKQRNNHSHFLQKTFNNCTFPVTKLSSAFCKNLSMMPLIYFWTQSPSRYLRLAHAQVTGPLATLHIRCKPLPVLLPFLPAIPFPSFSAYPSPTFASRFKANGTSSINPLMTHVVEMNSCCFFCCCFVF